MICFHNSVCLRHVDILLFGSPVSASYENVHTLPLGQLSSLRLKSLSILFSSLIKKMPSLPFPWSETVFVSSVMTALTLDFSIFFDDWDSYQKQ